MVFALTLETNLRGGRNSWIHDLSEKLGSHFAEKSYGDDLKELFIGIIAIAPEFDFFFKIRKPKYRQGKRVHNKYGTSFTTEDCVEYDVKLDFSLYSKYKQEEFVLNLKKDILTSIQVLKQIKKLKDFDFDAFECELRNFLKTENNACQQKL